MLETFAFFPLAKPSIILWIATHLLCVYRNNQHLSKMNSQRSEDSAEALLLSGWKLATSSMLHASPTGITRVPGKRHPFTKGTDVVLPLRKWNPQFFIFFLSICSWTTVLRSLKALPQGCHSWETQTAKAHACSQIQHRLTTTTLHDLKSGRNFKQMYQ